MTNSLQQMSQRRDQWINEKSSFDNSNKLFLGNGDLVWFQFVANGDEGDRFIKVYRAHSFEGFNKNGGRTNPIRYCPTQSGETEVECAYCAQGHTVIKERMSIWMYVPSIFRATIRPNTPPDKVPPLVRHEDKTFYNETVNNFLVWHTSAWKDSPWGDIVKLDEMYKGLHNFAAQLVCTGEQLQRRYKLYPIPNTSGITKELYELAQQECKPIIELLKEELASPVIVNPAVQQQQAPAPAAGVMPFSSPFGTPTPAAQPTESTGFNPFASAPATAPQTEPAESNETPVRPLENMFPKQEESEPEKKPSKLPKESMF